MLLWLPICTGASRAAEPDGAGKLMMGLNLAQAAKDMSGAVDETTFAALVAAKWVLSDFAWVADSRLALACQRPDAVAAAAPFYGVIPWPSAQPDWDKLTAVVEGHYAEHDDFASPEMSRALESDLVSRGKNATIHVYPGTHHAFFNDTRADVYDAQVSATAWERTLALFSANL
jgi:carboxymethylenebutenolidase